MTDPTRLIEMAPVKRDGLGGDTINKADLLRAIADSVAPTSPPQLSARWQELFWALPPGEMRSKLRALEMDMGVTLRAVSELAAKWLDRTPILGQQQTPGFLRGLKHCAVELRSLLQAQDSQPAQVAQPSNHPAFVAGPAVAPTEDTHMSHGSMATGTPQGHAPIARPVCSLHKTPKRAHYYCLQCVEAGEYEVHVNSATVTGPADSELIEAVGTYMVRCYLPKQFEHLSDKIAEVVSPAYGDRFGNLRAGPADAPRACQSTPLDALIAKWRQRADSNAEHPEFRKVALAQRQCIQELAVVAATAHRPIEALKIALSDLLDVSGDPNAITGEFDTTAGRARRLLNSLAASPASALVTPRNSQEDPS